MAKEYHFRSDHVDETTPHLHCDFVPLTKRESIFERRDRATKENAQDARNFLKQCKKGCLALNLHRLEPERKAQFNGLDQKLYEKMTASSKEREDKLCDREDTVETRN